MALKWKIFFAAIAILISAGYAIVRHEQSSMFSGRYKAEQRRVLKFMDPSRAWKQ
jgi:hypothetical protein